MDINMRYKRCLTTGDAVKLVLELVNAAEDELNKEGVCLPKSPTRNAFHFLYLAEEHLLDLEDRVTPDSAYSIAARDLEDARARIADLERTNRIIQRHLDKVG